MLSKSLIKALNEQINAELFASKSSAPTIAACFSSTGK